MRRDFLAQRISRGLAHGGVRSQRRISGDLGRHLRSIPSQVGDTGLQGGFGDGRKESFELRNGFLAEMLQFRKDGHTWVPFIAATIAWALATVKISF